MSDDAMQMPFGADEQQPQGAPQLQIVGQYIKDLSFENPAAVNGGMTQRPQIDMAVDLQAKRRDAEYFEVELKLRVHAKAEEQQLFLCELAYGAIVRLANVPEEALQPILLIQTPHMLFPFARRIIADIVRDGGMPALMIEPIDFASLYQTKLAQGQIGGL